MLLQEMLGCAQQVGIVAMLAGFDYVRGDCVVIMDADLQDPPTLIPQMLEFWELGFQDVYAKRADRGSESWLRKQFSLVFYKILDRSTRFEMLQNVGDFRLLDRKCIDALIKMRETERYTKGMFCWIGYKKKEIVFNRGDRVAGASNWSFRSLFNLAIEGITSFTTAPLRFASIMGFMIAFIAFAYLIYFFEYILSKNSCQSPRRGRKKKEMAQQYIVILLCHFAGFHTGLQFFMQRGFTKDCCQNPVRRWADCLCRRKGCSGNCRSLDSHRR